MSLSRKERGLNQSLYLIEAIPTENPYQKKFAVMGTTGNVYDVTIREKPECTCPDYMTRGGKCKHIFFVLLKVMKVADKNKRKYSNQDLLDMFANIPEVTSNLIVNPELRSLYKKKVGEEGTEELDKDAEGKVKRQPTKDEICPICLENLEDENDLDYCKYGCGKSIHKKCFNMWCKKNQRTCVFCRTNWEKEIAKNNIENSYINLIGKSGSSNSNYDYYYESRKYKKRWGKRRWYDYDSEEEDDDDSYGWSVPSGSNSSYLNSMSEGLGSNNSALYNNSQTASSMSNANQYRNFSKEDFSNGFQVFLKLEREDYMDQNIDNKEILRKASAKWKELPHSDRESYELIAKYAQQDNMVGNISAGVAHSNRNLNSNYAITEEEKEIDEKEEEESKNAKKSTKAKQNKTIKPKKTQKNNIRKVIITEENKSDAEQENEINIERFRDSTNREYEQEKNKNENSNLPFKVVRSNNSMTNENSSNIANKAKSTNKLNKDENNSRSKSMTKSKKTEKTVISNKTQKKSSNSNATKKDLKSTDEKTTVNKKRNFGKTKQLIEKDKRDKRRKIIQSVTSESENE